MARQLFKPTNGQYGSEIGITAGFGGASPTSGLAAIKCRQTSIQTCKLNGGEESHPTNSLKNYQGRGLMVAILKRVQLLEGRNEWLIKSNPKTSKGPLL